MKLKKTHQIILHLLPLITIIIIARILKGNFPLVPFMPPRIDAASMAVLLGVIFSFTFIRVHYQSARQQKELERLRYRKHTKQKHSPTAPWS